MGLKLGEQEFKAQEKENKEELEREEFLEQKIREMRKAQNKYRIEEKSRERDQPPKKRQRTITNKNLSGQYDIRKFCSENQQKLRDGKKTNK